MYLYDHNTGFNCKFTVGKGIMEDFEVIQEWIQHTLAVSYIVISVFTEHITHLFTTITNEIKFINSVIKLKVCNLVLNIAKQIMFVLIIKIMVKYYSVCLH